MKNTAIVLFIGLAAPASAQTTLPGFNFKHQETSEWCFAASTQMIGDYFGSHYLQQCEIANRAYGLSDCCDPARKQDSDCVGNGSHASDTLDYWGFPHGHATGALSFNSIRDLIDNNQPVLTRLTWTDSGSNHYVVVDGYWVKSDGSKHVRVNNPLASAAGWMTYNTYLSGGTTDSGNPFGDHTIIDTYYGFGWSPLCSQDFHELAEGDYQKCFDQRHGRGQYASDLASGLGVMGGAFESSVDRYVTSNSSLGAFDDWVDSHSAARRPDRITVQSGSTPLYSGILVQESSLWVTHAHLDSQQLQSTHDSLPAYRMRDLFAYNENGTTRFSAVWVKEAGLGPWHKALALSELASTDTGYRNQGYRLARLSTYVDGSGVWRAAALWLPSTLSYQFCWNKTASQYQTYYNTQTEGGYKLAYLSKYNGYYNAIFSK